MSADIKTGDADIENIESESQKNPLISTSSVSKAKKRTRRRPKIIQLDGPADSSDEDASDLFETDNVVVCQYDKITRARNKWKFHLKDGIMNLNGKDYVFQRANGDAEW